MFTRTELERKSIKELRNLCLHVYELKPIGNTAYKDSYINALLVFPAIALRQIKAGTGYKRIRESHLDALGAIIEAIGSPTQEQKALLKVTMEGKTMEFPERYDQEALLNLHVAKWYLQQAMLRLTM
ncbi:hypothetical protein BZZ01_32495 [Nostocales cyanobacterium HT-58-2]|nr:hypothetical protein BZZ01_32495 [Nostocales cyanobacterium HT-58-2]